FRVPVRVEQFVGHWLSLPATERTHLAGMTAQLGNGAVVGKRVWDRQHKIRLWIGPLPLQQYEDFLPGGTALAALVAWMRQYFCFELEWDVKLVLDRAELPVTKLGLEKVGLGKHGRLGWSSWLGKKTRLTDIADLSLNPEKLVANAG
ncbi:MAG TPA: type VI secretion system baseplate subunit TssG, partial [Pseudomonadales bacterium]|nr:type VI secretion system baseplate subunit TssG [Pseudomonadales bacterium]